MNLSHLTDTTLLNDTKKLVQQERLITTKILHHLKEIGKRRLYSDIGYHSLFSYAVKELGLSEGSAARRIDAARLLADLPQIEEKIQSGELNITNVSAAAYAFKTEDIQDNEKRLGILALIENTTKKECDNILREISTKEKPLTTIKINLTDEDLILLEELKGLLADRPKEKMWTQTLKSAIEKIKEEKFKLNAKEASKISSSNGTRYISAGVKKGVYLRDKACTKCGSKYSLQYDHIVPYSHGGKNTEENLRILCRSCNQRERITQKLARRNTSKSG